MNYLGNRYQCTKINGEFSDWEEVFASVPQGMVLGTLIFNIYIDDLFYAVENSSICNFADDTTPYLCGYKVNEVKRDVEDNCATLVAWFKDNFLPLNADK